MGQLSIHKETICIGKKKKKTQFVPFSSTEIPKLNPLSYGQWKIRQIDIYHKFGI